MNEIPDEVLGCIALGVWHIVISIATLGILRKAGRSTAWAFVPLANIVQLCQVAGIPGWSVVIVLVPCLNLVAPIYLALKLSARFGHSELLGIAIGLSGLLLLPILGYDRSKYIPLPSGVVSSTGSSAATEIPTANLVSDSRDAIANQNLRHTIPRTEAARAGETSRIPLISLSCLYALGLLCTPGLIVIGAMAFDAPGSDQNVGLWIAFGSLLLAPVSLLIALIGGWVLYALRRTRAALWLAVIPALNAVGIFVGIAVAIAMHQPN